MTLDLPEWLDFVEHGSSRDALTAARSARARCIRDGAERRAAQVVEAGDALLLDAERLLELGERGARVWRRLSWARTRYERASHEALDVSDGRCARCRGRLRQVDDETRMGADGADDRQVIIHQPAFRCDPCGVTYGEFSACRISREDGVVELLLRPGRWATVDPGDAESDDE